MPPFIMSEHMTMLELKQIEVDEFFREMKTIAQLKALSSPELSYGTIMNAINKGKLVCKKFGGDIEGNGVWLISLHSAHSLWPNRFGGKHVNK